MVVMRQAEYDSLHNYLQQIIDVGGALNHAHIYLSPFSTHDYNTVQSLYSQMFVRSIKKKTSRFDKAAMSKIVDRVEKRSESIRDIASENGYSPYKVAKNFLLLAHNMELSAFIENPLSLKHEPLR